jgi:hypothetical protein
MFRKGGHHEPTGISELPCSVCGGTAVTWNYLSIVRDGTQVIEGSPVCETHDQLRSEVAG